MINGFEEETCELSDDEKVLAKVIANVFKQKIGVHNAVTSNYIVKQMNAAKCKPQLNPARLRKIINYIRVNVLCRNLVATSKGYYVETDPKKIDVYVESLHQRADAILEVAKSFSKTIN